MVRSMKTNKRQIIFHTAAALFRKKGYTATSMRDLAKAVGMEAASLYNHIQSKQEILAGLLLDAAQSFMQGMDEIEQKDISPIQKIEKLISLHIHIAVNNTDAISLLTQEWRHLEGEVFHSFNEKRKDYELRFKNILLEGIRCGEIKDVNPDVALFSILSTMRWFYAWYSKKDGLSIEELEEQFSSVLIAGLQK